MNVKKLFRISILKTIWFNYKYQGFKGIIKPAFVIGKNIIITNLGGTIELPSSYQTFGIHIGIKVNEITVPNSTRGIWNNSGKIIFKGNADLGCGIKIISLGGIIEFGSECSINGNSELISFKEIHIGDYSNISWGCMILDGDFHSIYNDYGKILNPNCGINIGSHVWIGARCILLKGINIKNNTIIAAGSTITKENHHENELIGGENKVLHKSVIWSIEQPV